MFKFKLLWLALVWMFYISQGNAFTIRTNFKNGNLTFTWSNVSRERYDILVKEGSDWITKFNNIEYTVPDVTQNQSVFIKVRVILKNPPGGIEDHNKTFEVIFFKAMEGDSKNISWTAPYFPSAGSYLIFHTSKNSLSQIMKVTSTERYPTPEGKYVYHTQPFNSKEILLEVKNITRKDGGYYIGSTSRNTLQTEGGQGAVLVVNGKPVKPIITGNRDIPVGEYVNLKCKSSSTSTPDYYKKFPSLSYSWFVNDSRWSIQETYRFIVTKDVKYNRYSCQTKETLESENSTEMRINPLYGPENIKITPQPPFDELNIHDRDTFGPYTCSADCNPPCTVQWKYKHPSEGFREATPLGTSSATLPLQTANRTSMAVIRCVVNGTKGKETSNIKLNIQYLSDPKVYINGKPQNTLIINESNPWILSCLVDGNPPPEVILKKLTGDMIIENNNLSREARCSDTSTYSCEGKSPEFGSKNQTFKISVLCDPRFDDSRLFKPSYGSMSGPDVTIAVNLPVVANPLSSTMSTSEFIWTGPAESIRSEPAFEPISIKVSQRDNVVYKHWINSTIPVPDPRFFGNYSLIYKGKVLADITIKAEDKPQPPLDFSSHPYAVGFINLTWISNFNGGPEQFFILSQKQGSDWIKVANLTDPGEGKMGNYDLGTLTPGQQYWYQLQSCNRINCSSDPEMLKITVQALPTSSSQSEDDSMLIAIVSSAVGVVCIVIVAVVMTKYFLRKKSAQNHKTEERNSGSLETDYTQPDVVVYAAVDKSVLKKNRQQDDVVKSDVIKDQNVENDTVYSEVIKPSRRQKQTSKKNGQKNGEKKEIKGKKEGAGGSNRNENTREVNEDGLVYIDVEFTNKGFESDKKGKPVVHGEEERTEYTFVDFTKKAPPMEEPQDDAE